MDNLTIITKIVVYALGIIKFHFIWHNMIYGTALIIQNSSLTVIFLYTLYKLHVCTSSCKSHDFFKYPTCMATRFILWWLQLIIKVTLNTSSLPFGLCVTATLCTIRVRSLNYGTRFVAVYLQSTINQYSLYHVDHFISLYWGQYIILYSISLDAPYFLRSLLIAIW